MPDIIADFHGTLYQDADEGPLWRHVARQAVVPLESLRHPIRAVQIALAKGTLEGLAERYTQGEIGYDAVYDAYNRLVLSHLPHDFVSQAIVEYAHSPETGQKLDRRILSALGIATGKRGILSTGSKDFIRTVLADNDSSFLPSSIVANGIRRNGNGTEFVLRVYGNKPAIIEEDFFKALRFDPKRTVYLGDNEDEEPAFEYIAGNGGRIVVPFFASPEFKEYASARATYRDKVFVPETQRELVRFFGVRPL